jgi:protein SCO1
VPARRPAPLLTLLLTLLLGLVAGCGDSAGSGGQTAPVTNTGAAHAAESGGDGYRGIGLTQPYRMPDITLTDSTGSPYNLRRDTTKPVTLVFFGYTHCPDVCGLVMADMAAAMLQLEEPLAQDVQVLFVTTDPARDTPAVVKRYVDRFHPAFEGLTGPLPEIKAAAAPLGVPIEGMNRLPSGGYKVGHGSQIIGFAADDTARVVWTQGTPVEDLAADIHTLARARG